MKRIFYYIHLWWLFSRNAFQTVLSQKMTFFIFFVGKVLRFILFIGFLYFLLQGTNTLAGYSQDQVIFFFLTFSFVDTLTQFFYREVYRFRGQVVSGTFDLTLLKPMSALFKSLMSGADVIDLATLPPLFIALIIAGSHLSPSFIEVVGYIVLVLNALLISTAFHVFTLSLGIITLEVDYVIMMYRDLSSLGRFPISIYQQPLRGILTFLIPVAFMVTVPAQVFMRIGTIKLFVGALAIGLTFFFTSLRFWRYALSRYTSASS